MKPVKHYRLPAVLAVALIAAFSTLAIANFGPAQGSGGGAASSGLSGLGSTDRAVVITDGTSGDAVQGSNLTISADGDDLTVPDDLSAGGDASVGATLIVTGATNLAGLTTSGFVAGTVVDPATAGGRITLRSSEPVSTLDVVNQTTLYYMPYVGNQVALFNSPDWVAEETTREGFTTSTRHAIAPGHYRGQPGIGYHYVVWLERSAASGTTTWLGGDHGGIFGVIFQ